MLLGKVVVVAEEAIVVEVMLEAGTPVKDAFGLAENGVGLSAFRPYFG